MRLYFDTAYLAKCYWNEPDGRLVRDLAQTADGIFSSSISIAEMACVAQRKIREGAVTRESADSRRELFLEDLRQGVIESIPVSDRLLRRVESMARVLPPSCFLRTFDALHLVTALDSGFDEIWTNDRHMLGAAGYFGLVGRSVSVPVV